MASCMGEVCAKEDQVERDIASSKTELGRAFRNLESLLERTEMRMSAAVRRIDCVQAEVNEMREERNLACQMVADLEGDVQSEKNRASVSASPRRSSSFTRSRGASRHQRKVSLENLQRVLSDRGIELGEDVMSQLADYGRKTVISPTPLSWMNSRQKLEFHVAGGGVNANSTLSAFLAKTHTVAPRENLCELLKRVEWEGPSVHGDPVLDEPLPTSNQHVVEVPFQGLFGVSLLSREESEESGPHQAGRMNSQEETFFKEARVPVRLAAAAYSGEDDFQKLSFIAHGHQVEPVSKQLRPYLKPSDLWKENIVVHIAVIPVSLPSNARELNVDPKERHGEEKEEDPEEEELCWDLALVYRGTEPFSVKNWITDLTFEQEPVDSYILRHTDPEQQDKMQVHRGFQQAFKSIHPDPQQGTGNAEDYVGRINSAVRDVKQQIRSNLEGKMGEDTGSPRQQQSRANLQRLYSKLATCLAHPSPRRVLCIGHSLGGALAILAAAWCKTTLCGDSAFRGSQVHCITVGSPRVGNGAFAQAWNELLLDPRPSLCYRIVNALDPVPSMPPRRMFGNRYEHVGVPVYLERRVENWSIAVVAHLDRERPWVNSLSLFDHFQWNYTAAMDAAEVSSQQRSADFGKQELHGWVYWMSRQLKPAALWKLFVEIVRIDISLRAHFWMLLLSWGLGIMFLSTAYVLWFGTVFMLTFLLPALTCAFALDCVLRTLRVPHYHSHYRLGNLSLALLSVVVMVISYVAVWFGL